MLHVVFPSLKIVKLVWKAYIILFLSKKLPSRPNIQTLYICFRKN